MLKREMSDGLRSMHSCWWLSDGDGSTVGSERGRKWEHEVVPVKLEDIKGVF